MQEAEKIWMNGTLVDWHDAKVHVLSHGLHYGSSVFEGIRAYDAEGGTAVFRLDDHLARLERSAAQYFMEVPYSREEMRQAVHSTISGNHLGACYIRPIVLRGYGVMGLFPLDAPVDVSVAAWFWGAYLGEDGLQNGIDAKIASWRRIGNNTIPATAKAGGQYLNSILAKIETHKAGYAEAILLNDQGMVADGSGENIFIVKNGVISTPPLSASIHWPATWACWRRRSGSFSVSVMPAMLADGRPSAGRSPTADQGIAAGRARSLRAQARTPGCTTRL